MSLLTLQDAAYGHGAQLLFDGIELSISEGEFISLVGRNGAGKSTLMKILLGELPIERGKLIKRQNLKLRYLPQSVPSDLKGTVYGAVAVGLGEDGEVLMRAERCQQEVERDPSEANLNRLDKVHHLMEERGLWGVEQRLRTTISLMNMDPEMEVENVSAGLKRRVLLGRAVVSQPDILMLDEPTNHLDIPSILWLESFLQKFEGSLVFVSHDREFLRRLSTKTLVVDRGRCVGIKASFDEAMVRWEELERIRESEEKAFDKKLAEEEAWIRQGIKARRTRNEGRVRALESMRRERGQRARSTGQMKLRIQEAEKSGRKVIELKSTSYHWGEHEMFANLDLLVERGDKLAIIGPNGCGKTTLLKVLLKELEPSSGSVVHGSQLSICRFDQLHAHVDLNQTVRENLCDGGDWIECDGRRQHVMGYLQNFLFSPDRASVPAAHLSGGERNRLQLAKMFTKPGNVLVLDEPTNDLDMETLDLLVEKLADYQGTVLLVSHDRDFIDRVATVSLVFEEERQLVEYVGGYQDWLRQKAILDEAKASPSRPKNSTNARVTALSETERKELFNLPKKIEALEKEQEKIHEVMSRDGFYEGDPKTIEQYTTKLAQLEQDSSEAYERWEQLEEKNLD